MHQFQIFSESKVEFIILFLIFNLKHKTARFLYVKRTISRMTSMNIKIEISLVFGKQNI